MTSQVQAHKLQSALGRLPAFPAERGNEYQIADAVGPMFIARAPGGGPALLLPIDPSQGSVGRTGGGFTLTSAPNVSFDFGGNQWTQGAAVLECLEPSLFDAFLVLAADIAGRILSSDNASWQTMVASVEEWQALLANRVLLSAESQLGLWGELWIISRAVSPDALVAAWGGPDRDSVDFFLDGVGLEVKTSRRRRVHHISQTQLDQPKGEYPTFFVSIWAGIDPARGQSLTELVDQGLRSLVDPAAFLKLVTAAGYSPTDRDQYTVRYMALEQPLLFDSRDIPQVRAADPGISQLRYVVSIDKSLKLADDIAASLWRRMIGRDNPIA